MRRRVFGLLAAAALLTSVGLARGDVQVPLSLQAQLVQRLATFDRNFSARAAGTTRVLVLSKPGNSESELVAKAFAKALGELGDIGGATARVEEAAFSTGTSLAERCKKDRLAIVFFSTGLESEMNAVAGALSDVDVMTIGARGAHAERGAVVGFDLEEGHPKIVVNITRAKAQHVAFKAELLKLARIVE